MTRRGMRRIGALLAKEIEDVRGNPGLTIPAAITGAIAIMIPFVVAFAVPAFTGERLAVSSNFRQAIELYRRQPVMSGLDPAGAVQAFIFQRFLILLVLTPVAGAMSVAAHAVVGEKQARTLEPLLATPLTTFELLAAKVLGSLLPGVVLMTVGFALYVGGVAAAASPGVYLTLLLPGPLLTIFLLAPLASLAALQMAVCVSSRVSDARSAQQVSALIILPVCAIVVTELARRVQLTVPAVLLISAALAVLNALLMTIAIRLFDRESILTRWT